MLQNMKASFQRLHDSLLTLERLLLAFSLLAMLGIAIAQILLRNVFGSGFIWGDAAVRLLVLWTALLGAMQAAHYNEHIRIDALLSLFKQKQKRRIGQLTFLVGALICFLAAWVSADFVMQEYQYDAVAFGNLPSWLCAIIIPIAFVIIGLRFLLSAFTSMTHSVTPQGDDSC